ncbi:MAG: ATP-binding protein, partial [Pseudomonadota bacterium]
AEDARAGQEAVSANRYAVVSGERRAFRVVETPLRAGASSAFAGAALDITEADEAKLSLKRHVQAYNETLNHLPSAVAIFGPRGELIYHNTAFVSLWGLLPADLDSKPGHGEILDVLRDRGALPQQEDYGAWKGDQLAIYSEGLDLEGAPDELWNLPDGRTLQVTRQRHPFGGVLMVFDDITDELRLKTKYNTLISVQHATLNKLAEGVAVFASDGKLKLHNEAFTRLWDVPVDLLRQRPHLDQLVEAMDREVENGADHWRRLSERITSLSDDHRTPLSDGEIERRDGKTYLYATEPLPDGATLVSFLNVTDSKTREKALEQRNQALQDADAQKSAFVGHVSYQLRNPLNTIIGFSELLESEMFGPLNERQREYASGVLTASHQLLDLINDIIDLAAIDAGRMTLDLGDVDVEELLKGAMSLAALKAQDTEIALTLDCGDDVGVIRADEVRLKQVLFNLLSNAFAYTTPGGAVTLGAERLGQEVRVWVSDTGCGIDPRSQARAFDRFEGGGTAAGAGLGLALVRSFVELHGGWVALKSAPDRGTTVVCHLPENASCLTAPELTLAGETVMVGAPAAE